MTGDCPSCGHMALSHNTGRCEVSGSATVEGVVTFPGGCGCTALPFDMTCTRCAQPFVCAQGHEPHLCRSCYDVERHAQDAASFGPLIDALQRRNIPVTDADIWNTGGHVMCLGLHLTEDRDGPYVMWSDDAEYIGFGVYPDSDHTGLFVSPLGGIDASDDRPQESYSWAFGDNAQRAADLAVRAIPAVVRWLDTVEITKSQQGGTFGPYEHREIVRPYPALVVADAEVNDFDLT